MGSVRVALAGVLAGAAVAVALMQCWGMTATTRWVAAAVPVRAEQAVALPEAEEEDASAVDAREAEQLGILREIEASNTGLSPRHQQRLAAAIVREAHRNALDPLLVAAVIRVESNFDSFAISPVGALGLMQLMPDTGLWLARQSNESLRGARYLFDYERNVELGCAYLARLIEDFGQVQFGLVAYNLGPTAAKKVLSNRRQAREALAGYARKVLVEYGRLGARAEAGGELSDAPAPLAAIPVEEPAPYCASGFVGVLFASNDRAAVR